MIIKAAKVDEIRWDDCAWIFVDIGFSNNKRSCGVLFGDDNSPSCLRFGEANTAILHRLQNLNGPVKLVVEAPLSVCFDKDGNPKGRSIEKSGSKTRYWYNGLGCAVMTAAVYLIRSIQRCPSTGIVLLAEGFISFKNPASPTSHASDALLLRSIVKGHQSGRIHSPDTLTSCSTDVLESAVAYAGEDIGIPPVISNLRC
jgi:hypothetical protein